MTTTNNNNNTNYNNISKYKAESSFVKSEPAWPPAKNRPRPLTTPLITLNAEIHSFIHFNAEIRFYFILFMSQSVGGPLENE